MTSRDRQTRRLTEAEKERAAAELGPYFAGALEGAMGLHSWLGGWQDHGPTRASTTTGVPPEPGTLALKAARDMECIEGALVIAGRRHGLVLASRFAPRGPYARLSYGELTGVVLAPVLEPEVLEVFSEEDERSLRSALRCGSDEEARAALECVHPGSVHDRVIALEGGGTSLRAAGVRRARRLRARLKALAGRAVDLATVAYLAGREECSRAMRAGRIRRFTGSMTGREEVPR